MPGVKKSLKVCLSNRFGGFLPYFVLGYSIEVDMFVYNR